jgi:hypothetical protein
LEKLILNFGKLACVVTAGVRCREYGAFGDRRARRIAGPRLPPWNVVAPPRGSPLDGVTAERILAVIDVTVAVSSLASDDARHMRVTMPIVGGGLFDCDTYRL